MQRSGQAFLGLPQFDFVVNYLETFVVETENDRDWKNSAAALPDR